MSLKILKIVFLICLCNGLSAQEHEFHFKHFTREQGLPSNNVFAINQDKEGFMWFGTGEGLSRFDGYSFLNFSHSSTDTNTLSNNLITCIEKDNKGNLWVGTMRGLNYFDLSTYTMHRMPDLFNDNIGIHFIKFLKYHNNKLYVATKEHTLFVLNTANNDLAHYVPNAADSNSIISDNITGLVKDKNNNIWLNTDLGLELMDTLNGSFSHYFSSKKKRMLCLMLDNEKNVLCNTMEDHNWYRNSSSGFIKEPGSLPWDHEGNRVIAVMDSQGNKWVASRDNGVYFENPLNEHTLFQLDDKNITAINSNRINHIFEDKHGNLWFATNEGGVNFLDNNRKPFIHFKASHSQSGLKNNRIRAIYQDSDGDVWIGSKMGGMLSKFSPGTNSFVHYQYNANNTRALNDDFVISIIEEKPGILWVSTLHGGLNIFDKRKQEFIPRENYFNGLKKFDLSAVYTFCKDNEENIWMGLINGGIIVYNTKTGTVNKHSHSSNPNSLSSNQVRSIYSDKKGKVWVGTFSGLNLYNKQDNNFIRFQHHPEQNGSLSDNEVVCILETSQNQLWVGTNNGLSLFNKENKSFKNYTVKNGLPNNTIAGILEDENKNLWISTLNGICKFNPETNEFSNYDKEDGLQNNEFSKYVSCKLKNGKMIFGGNNGFNIFNPEKIINNPISPLVLLSDFKIFNQSVTLNQENSPLSEHIWNTTEITLNHKQNALAFTYAAINYSTPSKNRYTYILENYEDKWNDAGNKREASYTNLDPGTYTFKIKAANNDGVWNQKGVSLSINILPPPWLTWWAYCLYAILGISLILWYIKFSSNKIKREKEKELDQEKLKFFINISHEFRTPITLILNPVKKLLKEVTSNENKELVSSIYQSTQKMSSLVNQLLDFRKLDMGKMPLNASKTNIVPFTEKIVKHFGELAKSKNITITFTSYLQTIDIWVDLDKYEKIVNNLLSNAIKFSHSGGMVNVGINKGSISDSIKLGGLIKKNSKINSYIELSVKDNGIGIQKKHLSKIFDRFQSLNNEADGTGIGLNFVKSLVDLHHGKIHVESDPKSSKQTIFTVYLPLGNRHLRKEQISKEEYILNEYPFNTAYRASLKYELDASDNYVPENDKSTKEQATPGLPSEKLTILIVEDNNSLRKQLKDELKSTYKIKEAANGLQGLELSNKFFPDLIISDVMMPKMDGIEFCEKIKTNFDTCHIPVILLTAKTQVEHRIQGYETGADDYISKPFDLDELQVRISNILESRKRLKEKFSNSNALIKASECTVNNKDEVFLDELTKFALDNISNPDFNHNDLIRKSGHSKTGFYRKIKALTNMSPSNFLNTIKIKHAAELLTKEETTVKEVCFKVGFNYQSYFNKTFLKVMGKTPLEYLKENKKKL